MDRRKFIGACTTCAFATLGAGLLNKNSLILSDEEYVMHHIEVHIAEHCNLSCKYCGHYSCIADKEFYDLDKFRQDMKQMSSVFNKQLIELPIMGGEPLLNPDINEYIKISRKYFPQTRIDIVTNAVLLDDMDDNFWKTLNQNNVAITPSIYPIKINWKSILNKAQKYNVTMYGEYKLKEKLTMNNIDKFQKNVFSKMALTKKENKIDRSNCEIKFRCNNMYDGKIYTCPTAAYIRHLNKKFNTDFAITQNDYIDLYKIKSVKEIKEFLENTRIPFCRYCGMGTIGVKWENSPYHDISEWT